MPKLVFDTETSGLVNQGQPPGHPSQPKIIQICGVMLTDDYEECARYSSLVDHGPDLAIDQKAFEAHGISAEKCHKYGLKAATALSAILAMANRCDTIVAHNISFDMLALEAGCFQAGIQSFHTVMQRVNKECTQALATPILMIPPSENMKKWGRENQFKTANLKEAHLAWTGTWDDERAHDGIYDALACAEVYKAIKTGQDPEFVFQMLEIMEHLPKTT